MCCLDFTCSPFRPVLALIDIHVLSKTASRFLDHWEPDLSIGAEQEIWPGLVYWTNARTIPLALVNARMNAASYQKRRRIARLMQDSLSRFAVVSAHDADSAKHLVALGARAARVDGSLKSLAPALAAEGTIDISKRFVWVAASSHKSDEIMALAAHAIALSNRRVSYRRSNRRLEFLDRRIAALN